MIDDILERGCKEIVIQVLDNGTQISALHIIRCEIDAMKQELINHISLQLSKSTEEYGDIRSRIEEL